MLDWKGFKFLLWMRGGGGLTEVFLLDLDFILKISMNKYKFLIARGLLFLA